MERHKELTGQLPSFSALWTSFRTKIIRRKFVQNVGVLTIANFIGAALSFAQGIVVARWLGPELYGVAALVMSYPSLVLTFFDARSSEASVKYLSEFHACDSRDRALAICKLGYTVDFAIALLAFLVVAVSAHWAAGSIVNRPGATWLIIAYSAAFIPQALVGTSRSVFTILGEFRFTALIDALMTLLRVGLVLGLVMGGWEVTGVVWGTAISMAASGLLYVFTARVFIRRTWGASEFQGDWQALKGRRLEIMRFLVYSDLSALLGMIPKQLDVLLLGYFRSPVEAGYYKLAKSLSGLVGYLVGPLQSVTYPELARLSGTKVKPELRQKIRRLALYVGVPLGLVALAGTSVFSVVLPALVGDAYSPAVELAQILLIGSAIWLACFWLRPLYLAQGEMKLWMLNAVVVATLTSVGFVLVAPTWGALGLAWVLLVVPGLGGHLFALLYLYYGKKVFSSET